MIGFMIHFDEKNQKPKYVQLYEYIRHEIMKGELKEGDKLPSIRTLSKALYISKSTVENAYNQLAIEGYIDSKNKSGYYVVPIETFGIELKKTPIKGQVTYESSEQSSDQNGITAGEDILEATHFPFEAWKKIANQVLDHQSDKLLSQGDGQGEQILRAEIAQFVHQSRGGIVTAEQVVVGAGIQYLFGILAAMFREWTSDIAFEYPGFSKGMYIFEDYGFRTHKIPVMSNGIDVEQLESSNCSIVYVSPSHQYPTGSIMTINQRLKLLNWAKEKKGYIIEDDYDSILRYDGYPIPALQGLGRGEHVIYMGSFSKLLMPSLRISFMVLPEALMARYEAIKSRYSQTVSKWEQLTLAHFMRENHFERHLRRLKKIYGRRNQLLIDAFNDYGNHEIKLIGKASGLHVMLQFKKEERLTQSLNILKQMGIKLEPVGYKDSEPIAVLSYSGIPDDQIPYIVAVFFQ